jgi:hypothetical protein
MSEIFPGHIDADPQVTRGSEANAVSLKNRFGWLREWELAQWCTSQRTETTEYPSKQQTIGPELGSQKTESGNSNDVRDEAKREVMQNPTPAPAVTGNSSQARLSPGIKVNAGVQQDNFIVNSPLGGAYSPVSYYQGSVSSLASGGALSSQFLWPSKDIQEWQPYLLHVVQTDSGVRVSVRDKRFKDISGNNLIAKVRGELTTYGICLASLTVNGREIWRAVEVSNDASGPSIGNGVLAVDRVY